MALVAFVPATLQSQQQVRITGGPTLDTVNSNSVFITWSTSLPSSSRVWWSKDKNNLTHLAEGPESGQTSHRVEILNLEPNTTYYFTVESGQTRGTKAENEAETPNVYSFTTTAPVRASAIRHRRLPKLAPSPVISRTVKYRLRTDRLSKLLSAIQPGSRGARIFQEARVSTMVPT